MKRALCLLMLLLVMPASAQDVQGPDVVMLVHHPFPDDADPLGFAYQNASCQGPRLCDAFAARHNGVQAFQDGVAYPGFIADGLLPIEGLVEEEGKDVLASTLAAYDESVRNRLAMPTPVTLSVATRVVDGELRSNIWTLSSAGLSDQSLHLWVALVEDPVFYQPPPALSNGVFEHPFTTRFVQDLGPVQIGLEETQRPLVLSLDEAWNTDRLRLAVWIQNDAGALGRFEPNEVVQAASHPVTASFVTVQKDRAVLVEGYSATWCEPCLVGDLALETLAETHGLPTGRIDAQDAGYFQPPRSPIAALILVIGAAMLAWRWRPGGGP